MSTSALVTDQAVISALNRGPITTIFSPPPSCMSTLTMGISMYFAHQDGDFYDPACFPSSTIPESRTQWDIYYYSPAQCPLGWSEATTYTSSFTGHGTSISLSLRPDTTAVLCCPSGYSYLDYDHRCGSGFADVTTYLTFFSPNQVSSTWSKGQPLVNVWNQGSSTWTIYGDGIPVWYQSSDKAIISAAASTTSSHNQQTRTTTHNTATMTPTTPSTSDSQSNGLSNGAKIGLGVGIPLAVLLIASIAFAFYMRRRRIARGIPADQTPLERVEVAEVPGYTDHHVAHELYADNIPKPRELPVN